MGSAESAEARRVSFEMDEEERVRVLQGIRLSESVVNRMKDSSQPSAGPCPVPTVPAPTTPAPTSPPSTTSVPSMPVPIAPPPSSSDPSEGAFKAPPTDSKVPRAESGGGQQPSAVKEDLKRFQQEQAVVQDELAKVAKREKEAVEKHLKASLPKKRASPTREQQKSALLARELEKREAELNRRDTFYKEQQGRIQEKNAEIYKLSSQQFHEAASKAESTIKPRRVEPVCSGLQAQILRCYRDHLHEVLLCSDLVKEYQHCVSTARKG
ncbi:MICOS complex subunit MIC25 isoform X4 [Cricetulus griseus]|uniref:Coiled-coil-helix-coiled-coil-helix domain containing 6 n=1 Tax=Cricetulus griseus TaxID=10029 RepID=A0A8C2QK44_CRIGR|nr:MICOS complex subunit MIC25 isoform X4 [Cricetulus griseus]XP_027284648.1 MICOS complex subunit MIC25 isoform X4 [Cricetulus griseus]